MSGPVRPTTRQEAELSAQRAWEAFVGLVRAETPELKANEYWQALKDTAHARFRAIFESEALK